MVSKLLFALFVVIVVHIATAQTLWPQRGNFMITSRTIGGQVLGVLDGHLEPGARIGLANPQTAPNGSVIWSYQFDNMLINKRSGLALTVHKPNSAGSVNPGTSLVQERINTSSTIVQLWNYFAGTGQIHPRFAGDLCIAAARQSNGGGATIEKCSVGNAPEQLWTVTVLPGI